MSIGFVFLVLALGSAAISVAAYREPPAWLSFGMQIATVVVAAIAAAGFGGIAAVVFVFT